MGPDPASINTCTVGGILSNNSSGMCCGVVQNAYHTLDSLTFVLPSGTVIDTAAPDADEAFRRQEPALAQGLLDLKREIESNAVLAARIRGKYRMKNTTGYSLNAFLDYSRGPWTSSATCWWGLKARSPSSPRRCCARCRTCR